MTSSLSQKVFKGAKWYVAMRWSIRFLGIISSAFLARLLVPEDFGLVALVMVIYGLINLLFQFGVNWALIQNNKATDEHFDTAWSIRLIQSVAVAVLLAVSAPWVADFYGDARLVQICQILAVATLVRGFENIGTVKLQKELKFKDDFKFNVLPKLVSTGFTIALAFYFQSFLALVFGTVFHNLIVVVVSYRMVSYKPSFSFSKLDEIWGFSKWILVRNLADYVSRDGDLFMLSSLTTAGMVGYYRWGTELSFMTISEVQQPFSRVLVPSLVKIKNDHVRLIDCLLYTSPSPRD